jgi:hypothetical protein
MLDSEGIHDPVWLISLHLKMIQNLTILQLWLFQEAKFFLTSIKYWFVIAISTF